MEQILIKAPAKINLSLDIVGVRDDGYHLMQMIMQTISLYDYIKITKSNGVDCNDITISCNKNGIPTDKSNIAHKTATAFFRHIGANLGVHIDIEKNIPSCAGMGGGSADGAGVLVGLNTLFGANLSQDELIQIGQTVGADIPFCLCGGTAFVEGIGEQITSLNALPQCFIAVTKPALAVSTKSAFAEYDVYKNIIHPNTQRLLEYVKTSDLRGISKNMGNVFEQVIHPSCSSQSNQLVNIKNTMLESGAIGAMMTGSGSAVFGIFTEKENAQNYISMAKIEGEHFLCQPVQTGAEVCFQKTNPKMYKTKIIE